jgi:hypothetical protein
VKAGAAVSFHQSSGKENVLMGAHSDTVFEIFRGKAQVESFDEDEEEGLYYGDIVDWPSNEFEGCADGWYWQHRRFSSGIDEGLGEAFGPLIGPFTTEAAAKAHQLANTCVHGAGRL